jgi:hypothetical protein
VCFDAWLVSSLQWTLKKWRVKVKVQDCRIAGRSIFISKNGNWLRYGGDDRRSKSSSNHVISFVEVS